MLKVFMHTVNYMVFYSLYDIITSF